MVILCVIIVGAAAEADGVVKCVFSKPQFILMYKEGCYAV